VPTFSIDSLKAKDLGWSLQPYCERQANSQRHTKDIPAGRSFVTFAVDAFLLG